MSPRTGVHRAGRDRPAATATTTATATATVAVAEDGPAPATTGVLAPPRARLPAPHIENGREQGSGSRARDGAGISGGRGGAVNHNQKDKQKVSQKKIKNQKQHNIGVSHRPGIVKIRDYGNRVSKEEREGSASAQLGVARGGGR